MITNSYINSPGTESEHSFRCPERSFLLRSSQKMVHYKLIYFNVRGRAELARLILHYAQVPFEDHRVEGAQWPQLKARKYINIVIGIST